MHGKNQKYIYRQGKESDEFVEKIWDKGNIAYLYKKY